MKRKKVMQLLLTVNLITVSTVQAVHGDVKNSEIKPENEELMELPDSEEAAEEAADDEEEKPSSDEEEAAVDPAEYPEGEDQENEIEVPLNEDSFYEEFFNKHKDIEEPIGAKITITDKVVSSGDTEQVTGSNKMQEEIQTDAANSEETKVEYSQEKSESAAYPDVREEVPEGSAEAVNRQENSSNIAPPEISIQDITAVSTGSNTVVPRIHIRGAGTKQTDIEIHLLDSNGRKVQSGCNQDKKGNEVICTLEEISEDGLYTLYIKGVNENGSLSEKKYVFTVNKAGTTFVYDKSKADIRIQEVFTPKIRMENLDEITILSCMLNGVETAYEIEEGMLYIDEQKLTEGKNRITLEVKDGAGNVSSMEPWEFYLENTDKSVDSLEDSSEMPVNEANSNFTADGAGETNVFISKLFHLFGKSHV